MERKMSDIERTTERLLTSIGTFSIVNQSDLRAVLPDKDISNNIRQLKYKGLVNAKNIRGMRLLYLTDEGQERLTKYQNHMQEKYELDRVLEQRDYSREAYQRHSRGKIAFVEGNVNATRMATIEMGDREAVYIDSYIIKKHMGYGDDIRSSRVTGICLTPDESFVVYCCEGGFTKVDRTERAFKSKLLRTLPQSKNRSELKEIVVGSDISAIYGVMFGRRQVNLETTSYIAEATDRDKYYVPIEQSGLQIKLLTHAKFRDETINTTLEQSLIETETLPGLKRISNREITDFENGKIANLLDLNIGLIKQVKYYADEGKNMSAIILAEYKKFFNELFEGKVDFIEIEKSVLENAMKDAGIER